MDAKKFDNEVICPAVYAWLKGSGPEPYSPAVASLVGLVIAIVEADRARSVTAWQSGDRPTLEELIEVVRKRAGLKP